MQKKRRRGRTSTKTSVEDEIAHLRGLDLGGLRARWQGVFQRSAPAHLTRHLLFAVIAYRLQADRFGDLDHEIRQMLDRAIAKEAGPAMSARLANFDQKPSRTRTRLLLTSWPMAVMRSKHRRRGSTPAVIPDSILKVVMESLTHHGLLPERGYLENRR